MPVFRLSRRLLFPDPALASPSGLLAVGGDLSTDRLLLAYRHGIFPWFSHGDPILWWSPDPRMVLPVEALTVPRSLAKRIRRGDYRLTMDQAFEAVIARCARAPRPGQYGTWITDEMQRAYVALHERGHAHSVEAWRGDELVGGLYGIAVGRVFCGESMFAAAPDASKVAFVELVRQLGRWGYPLVDCQVHTDHLARFGADEVPRGEFIGALHALSDGGREPGPWAFDEEAATGR